MFDCSPVYYRNQQSTANIVINQGGTDSGKTYALMQLLFTIVCTKKAPAIDPVITIIGESIPNLKRGAYRHAENIYATSKDLRAYVDTWNKTDRTITFKTGWVIEFNSYETEQQAKQGKRQYAFFNEANGIPWLIFWQVAKRTRRQVFIDYNPTCRFWAHEKLIGTNKDTNDLSASVEVIYSDHRHNPFLTEEEHRRTENIKDKQLWDVYARGKTGNITGVIYPNCKAINAEDFPDDDNFFGGLDFGYTNDPTAAVKIVRIGDNVFIKQLCYEPGISPIRLKEMFNAEGFGGGKPIYCDHDKELMAALRHLGLLALPALKSINAGIEKVKEFNVYYTSNSLNFKDEISKYIWINDPDTGKPTNAPIDSFNHLMDAMRYGIYTHYFRA